MTLDCVEISLARVFESGQAYVALSRARSLEGLRVMDFDPRVVQANQDVLLFYKRLRKERLLMQVSPLWTITLFLRQLPFSVFFLDLSDFKRLNLNYLRLSYKRQQEAQIYWMIISELKLPNFSFQQVYC